MISVCIATYNGEKYIEKQVASITRQLGEGDEIVVADDGSTDNTLNILRGMGDKRIRIIDGSHRHSPIWNFEKALKSARGEYIFLADQDDVWCDNKVVTMMKWLKQYDCVVSDNTPVDEQMQPIADSFYDIVRMKPGKYFNLLVRNCYLGCCMAFTKDVLNDALPFPKDTPMHDIWIGNVAAFFHNVKFIPDKLILFCRHGDNASTTADKSKYSLKEKIGFRWAIARAIIKMKFRSKS